MERGESGRIPWPLAVSLLIAPLGDEFSLPEVYSVADPLRRLFPKNRHVEAKIRQSLQILRDRGEILFESHGRYRKLRIDARPSVRLDFGEAARYSSAGQVARVAVEAWAARNVSCWRCSASLVLLPANTALLDAICSNAGHEVQVKAVAGVAHDRILGAAHRPLSLRLETKALPDYLIVSYDRPRATVILAEFIDGSAITLERVVERRALKATARRAGWVGSTIDLTGLERHVVVGPSLQPEVRLW